MFLSENSTAVFVYRITDIQTGITEQDPIDYEGVLANTDGSYNYEEHSFTAKYDGYYFQGN